MTGVLKKATSLFEYEQYAEAADIYQRYIEDILDEEPE